MKNDSEILDMKKDSEISDPSCSSSTNDTLPSAKKEAGSGDTTLLIIYSSTTRGFQLSASLNFHLASVRKTASGIIGFIVILLLLLHKIPPETAKAALEFIHLLM